MANSGFRMPCGSETLSDHTTYVFKMNAEICSFCPGAHIFRVIDAFNLWLK